MNMPQDTSTSLHDPSTPTVVRLAGTAGPDGQATPRDVAGHLQAGRFFWLDLENPGGDELREFCQSLQLPAGAIESVMHASPRSSFALAAGSVQAVLPGAVGTGQAAWLEANYVTLVLTAQFLFTVHTAPSAPLQHARHQYCGLDDAHARADGGRSSALPSGRSCLRSTTGWVRFSWACSAVSHRRCTANSSRSSASSPTPSKSSVVCPRP